MRYLTFQITHEHYLGFTLVPEKNLTTLGLNVILLLVNKIRRVVKMKTRSFNGKQKDMKNISLLLDKNLHKQLRRYAFEQDKSISLVIEEAVKEKTNEAAIRETI